ncbi:tetratricopeptide repeat protein [Wenyingzhuangia sp. IMCC45574]
MKRFLLILIFSTLSWSHGFALETKIVVTNLMLNDTLKLKEVDTLFLINEHIIKADENKNNGLYALSYDELWKAMLLSEATNDSERLATIHNELGLLYGIYGKNKKAIEHKLKMLEYVKSNTSKKKKINLGSAYYSLAVQYRKSKEFNKSLIYLDSCLAVSKNKFNEISNPYVLTEKGNIFLLKGDLQQSEEFLIQARDIFEKDRKTFLIIVYKSLGDLYLKKKDKVKAIDYYKKSLVMMEEHSTHTDLKTNVLQKIATLHKEKQQLNEAYFYLEKSYKVADSLFSMKSKSNGELFEIKDEYQKKILKKDARISEQKHVIERKKRIQSQLLIVIVIIGFGVIGLLFYNYHKTKVRNLKVEQENTATQIKHDKEKLNAVLETKSKELTVSALQLIEKDKNIDKLLEVLKEESPASYRRLQKDIVRGNKDLWERFNLRFTEVNTDFYQRLRNKHETLTPTEQKHCALIKLKFDSKEMAGLLNISVNSVHISRHRIRKKIGLKRDDDLSNYIASI